jgi:hypothetical protein
VRVGFVFTSHMQARQGKVFPWCSLVGWLVGLFVCLFVCLVGDGGRGASKGGGGLNGSFWSLVDEDYYYLW